MLGAVFVCCFLFGIIKGSLSNDPLCIEKYCLTESEQCFTDETCIEFMLCSSYCMETWDNDPTNQKVHAQNCTMKCTASYENNITDSYMGCLMNHNCITFPPMNITCPANLPNYVDPNASIANLEGEWWQHYGYNQFQDCYPCQHIHNMTQINDTNWAYDYSYDVYMVNNSLRYYEQVFILPNTIKGNTINITYWYMGTIHNESWYILSANQRYVILVYCSYINTWINVGSIVWVRPDTILSQNELNYISNIYNDTLGWKFPQQFCQTQHGPSCKNIS